MRILGGFLIVIGALWFILCFLSTAMMSRGVDWFWEAVLPSLFGMLVIVLGAWMLSHDTSKPSNHAP